MEMVLQQSIMQRPGMSSSIHTGGGCRPGPRPAAATAPMMMAMAAKQEAEAEREPEDMGSNNKEVEEDGGGLRRGPWTVDEDLTLINYIAEHGEGRWNALARAAGLKRTGKSCRLRWLNYLRPDVKRGDFTADEQLLILDLHSRWGNRWSKIAAQLPGRTDNEIKNYWRTRVQKHAKQLNCDVNSKRFKDAMRFLWMPRLAERASAAQHQQQPATISGDGDAGFEMMMMMNAAAAAADDRSPSSVVTTNHSPSCSSSRTSSDSTAAHDVVVDRAAAPAAAGGDCCWGAVQTDADQEFWSTASALQHLTAAGDHHQAAALFQHDQPLPLMQDLSGWVQGFSDNSISPAPDSLWSLDDMIWRIQ